MASKAQFDQLLAQEDQSGKQAVGYLQVGASAAYARSARKWAYDEAARLFEVARDAAATVASLFPSAEGCSTANACEYAYKEQKQIQSWGLQYLPGPSTERAAAYDAQAAAAAAKSKALYPSLQGPLLPRPWPSDPVGGANPDDPFAPPPDPQTQLGLVAAAALVLYAGWELLRRAAGNRKRA